GIGAALAGFDLLAPLYLSAGLAVLSSFMIRRFLPEETPPVEPTVPRPPRLSVFDSRVAPFVAISASLQAVRATTTITLACGLQAPPHLTAAQTVQRSGIAFATMAIARLLAELLLVQPLRPPAPQMLRTGI